MKMPLITVRVSRRDRDAIHRACSRRCMTRSAWVRMAVAQQLAGAVPPAPDGDTGSRKHLVNARIDPDDLEAIDDSGEARNAWAYAAVRAQLAADGEAP